MNSLPVILLHAAGRTPQMWQSQVEAIAASGAVPTLAPWLAGLRPGRAGELSLSAAAEEVLATMDRNGISSARLVGHQLGAMVALQVAASEPSMVAGLVLSGAALAPSALALRVQRTLIRLMPKSALAESGASKADLLRALELMATADFGQRIDRITAPALVMAGANDPARRAAQRLAGQLRGGRYEELAGAGTDPCLEVPDAFNSLLVTFLNSTAAPTL